MTPTPLFTLMGILNLTPDSFSDGGQWFTPSDGMNLNAVVAHAQWLIKHGCTVLDVGGESTRPGAVTVSVEDELQRVLPAITALRQAFPHVALSIDTRKAAVAQAALKAGASIINDVSGLTYDAEMVRVVAESKATLVLMHSQGTPQTMQHHPHYTCVVSEVREFLQRQSQWAISHGVKQNAIVWDVGFGFGKTTEHNCQLLANLHTFTGHGYPVLLGTSRKSFLTLGNTTPPPAERDTLTAATVWHGYAQGCSWFRVHNPQAIQPVLALAQATLPQTVIGKMACD
ncbi:MAG: dihydropteroate synthase [Vampirovibrionales bacterium]